MIDFPANPTVGQVFSASGVLWKYDGVKWMPSGAWPISVGDSPPPNPPPGALWFCTTDCQLYIFYQDVNSSQWVCALNLGTNGPQGIQGPQGATGATGGTFADAPSDGVIYARRNALWVQSPTPAPGGRLTFNQNEPRPSNAEAATSIYYVPYLHPYVSVPASSSAAITMQIPPTGVVNNYSDATTNPAAVPASAVHFGLFLWNNNGVLTLTRSPTVSCATGGAVSPACALSFGPNNMVVNTAAITNGPAAKMGLYMGVAFTYSDGKSYMRTGGVSGGNFFGLANTYNRLTAATQLAYGVNSGPGNRATASVMLAAIANTGQNDYQRFTASWGFAGTGIVNGSYSGTHLCAGLSNVAQTPLITWYTISDGTYGSSSVATTVAGAPNLQPGCWTFYLGSSDANFTTISSWGRQNTEFSLEV